MRVICSNCNSAYNGSTVKNCPACSSKSDIRKQTGQDEHAYNTEKFLGKRLKFFKKTGNQTHFKSRTLGDKPIYPKGKGYS